MGIQIRTFQSSDQGDVIDLWRACGLTRPWNNPVADISRKVADSPDLFFVAVLDQVLIGSCMAGYDGHRGSIYYLAVREKFQGQGVARNLMQHSENMLTQLGCPKINLMVRNTNTEVINFYHKIDYADDPTVVLGRRLIEDEPVSD